MACDYNDDDVWRRDDDGNDDDEPKYTGSAIIVNIKWIILENHDVENQKCPIDIRSFFLFVCFFNIRHALLA